MKSFLSSLFSFLILFQSLFPSVFAQSQAVENYSDFQQESSSTSGDFFENPQHEESLGLEQDLDWLITNGWQSGQVLDSNFNSGVNTLNSYLNWGFEFWEWQDRQLLLQEAQMQRFDLLSNENEESNYLMISEVYFDGTDEWIEIYNDSESTFLWNFSLSGAKASTVNILNISIPSKTAIILGDNMSMVPDQSLILRSWLTLNLVDTSAIHVKLIFSWQIIDTFYVDTGSVLAIDNQKRSFQRFIDTKNITVSQVAQNYNISTWFIANPVIVYLENTWNDGSLDNMIPNLKITEIYFDGDDNRFEVTNLWLSGFSGNLNLSWNLNFGFSTNIPSWVSKVFANSIYSMFQTGTNIQTIPNPINFDTGEINLDLIRSGQILDNFFAHQTQVQHYYSAETSFEKIGEWNNWKTTVIGLNLDRIYNTNRWISANPTKYFTTWENLIDVTKSRELPVQDADLPINCADFREDSTLYISETHYWTGIYPSYVELNIIDEITDYYPQIKLSGSALSQEVTFNTNDMKINTKVLLTNSDTRYNEWRESKSNSNFALNNSWRLIVYGKVTSTTWYILDIIYLNWWVPGKSLYMWTKSIQCAGVFDYQDKFSPWLNIWQSQFIQITPEPVVQYINVWWWWGFCPESKWFDTSDAVNGDLQISSIKYHWDLQILKLKNKTSSDINLRDYQIQWFDGEIRSVKWNTLFAKQNMAFVWNYGFPTKTDHCVNILKEWRVVDRYCRNSLSKATSQDEENIKNQLEFWIDDDTDLDMDDELEEEILTWKIDVLKNIKIRYIDYDPPWADGDNESITLVLLTWTQVNLAEHTLQYIKDGKTTNNKLTGILTFGNQQIFKGNYTLPNSTQDKNPVVVNLLDPNKNIVDTYIYNPNKIKEIPNGQYKVLSIIDGDTIKISYLDQEFNIRLAWIDAPESSALRCGKVECFGKESKEYLQSLLQNQTIFFESEQKDDFDRFVWYVFLNWENINERVVKNWYAWEYSYKGKTYKHQSSFKSAQTFAKNNLLWLRWSPCMWKRLCPVEETKINEDYEFTIDHIFYDPEWADTWKEEITITMHKWFAVQFSEWFYLMVNNTKKSLKIYGWISPEETKTLKWNFGFPNTKATTISLMHEDIVFATYSYDPQKEKLLEKESENMSGVDIKITALIPNPKWKDSLGESVRLLYTFDPSIILSVSEDSMYTGIEDFKTIDSSPSFHSESEWLLESEWHELNLASGFYLKIGNTKKKLNWVLVPNQETLITWNFSLPNKAACIEVWYKNIIFDKFCYTHPKEWQKFSVSNEIFESILDEDFTILRDSKLQNIWNQVCLTYWSEKFYCKNMPYSKLSTQRLNQNRLYKEYFDVFEDYLKNQRKVMYYNSDIKNYFNLLNQIEKAISDWKSTFELDGIVYKTNEFKKMYESKYPSNASHTIKKKLEDIVPSPFIQKYEKLRKEYIEYLMTH